MPVLLGVLLDVSRSMEVNIDGKTSSDHGWIRSIFKALDSLIEHDDISKENKVFAAAVGGSYERYPVFDLLNTLEKSRREIPPMPESFCQSMTHEEIIRQGYDILKGNGANYVERWAPIHKIGPLISREDAITMLYWLKNNYRFRNKVVCNILPVICRTGYVNAAIALGADIFMPGKTGSNEEIEDVVSKIKASISDSVISSFSSSSILDVSKASSILRDAIGEKEELSKEEIDKMLRQVEPFIYGRTPLITALNQSVKLFNQEIYKGYKNVLFVLSDGDPTDGHEPPVEKLDSLGVTTIGCFITPNNILYPRRLYSSSQPDWEEGAMFMYNLSSYIETQSLPRSIFLKRGWQIDIENNETKLFAQVNHPDLVDETCDLAKNVIFCQDALTEVLSSVSLDTYISQTINEYGAPTQTGGTCYANAAATVMHLAMHRIYERSGGYPDFSALRGKMITRFGWDGAHTFKVLQKMCPKYRLHVDRVDVKGALAAIIDKRPVVTTFYLEGHQWDAFTMFYKQNPDKVLTKEDLNKVYPQRSGPGGHAVVLVGYNSNSLRFMNSWGDKFADKGFFRVRNDKVLNCKFFDVYWTLNDLFESEKKAFELSGKAVAGELVHRLQSLQSAVYQCKICKVESNVMEFTGTMKKVQCPRCKQKFKLRVSDKNIALVIYLTSLNVE